MDKQAYLQGYMNKEAYGAGDDFNDWSRFGAADFEPTPGNKVPTKKVIEALEALEEKAKKADVRAYVSSARYHDLPEDDETPPEISEHEGEVRGTGASPRALIEALKAAEARNISIKDPLYPHFLSIHTKEPSSVKRIFGASRPKLSEKQLRVAYGKNYSEDK